LAEPSQLGLLKIITQGPDLASATTHRIIIDPDHVGARVRNAMVRRDV